MNRFTNERDHDNYIIFSKPLAHQKVEVSLIETLIQMLPYLITFQMRLGHRAVLQRLRWCETIGKIRTGVILLIERLH